MARKVVTISFSLPAELAEQLNEKAKAINISRSSLLTAMITISMKWSAKEVLNGLYGKDTLKHK